MRPRQWAEDSVPVDVLLNGDVDGRQVANGLSDRARDRGRNALVEDAGDDVVRREFVLGDHRGDGQGSDPQNLRRDLLDLGIEEPPEEAGEREDVVDLVRVVRTPRRHDRSVLRSADRIHFGSRVRQGEDDGVVGHRGDVGGSEDVALGDADEDIGALEALDEGAVDQARVGRLGERLAARVHAFGVIGGQGPRAPVADDVLRALGEEESDDRIARRADARDDDADVLDLLSDELEGVDQRGEDDDRGTVLIVVEDRDVEFGAQPLLDLEAAGRGDVLQVDAAVGRGDRLDDRNDLLRIGRVEDDRPSVDAAELLEEHGLALHDGKSGRGPDVAQAEHRGSIGDDGDRVRLHREQMRFLGHVVDRRAHAGDARSVGARQVIAIAQRDLRSDFDLAADVRQEGLVRRRGHGHAGECGENVADLAPLLGVAQIAGEVEDDRTAHGLGDVEAAHLSALLDRRVDDRGDRRGRFVDLDPVGSRV